MAETIKIGGELESTATGNVVAAASAIKDKVKNKYQGEINAETDATLANHASAIQGLNSQNYVSVTATDQTTAVTDVLPATGSVNTIYRVGNWDGSQFDASVYSEYAWNGSAYVHISTKTQIGEVFDISAYHATGGELATYADLAAALDSNNGGGVPQSLQEGGMSVKFVRTSDNKYVQFRYIGTSTANADFVTIRNWIKTDDVVTSVTFRTSSPIIERGKVIFTQNSGINLVYADRSYATNYVSFDEDTTFEFDTTKSERLIVRNNEIIKTDTPYQFGDVLLIQYSSVQKDFSGGLLYSGYLKNRIESVEPVIYNKFLICGSNQAKSYDNWYIRKLDDTWNQYNDGKQKKLYVLPVKGGECMSVTRLIDGYDVFSLPTKVFFLKSVPNFSSLTIGDVPDFSDELPYIEPYTYNNQYKNFIVPSDCRCIVHLAAWGNFDDIVYTELYEGKVDKNTDDIAKNADDIAKNADDIALISSLNIPFENGSYKGESVHYIEYMENPARVRVELPLIPNAKIYIKDASYAFVAILLLNDVPTSDYYRASDLIIDNNVFYTNSVSEYVDTYKKFLLTIKKTDNSNISTLISLDDIIGINTDYNLPSYNKRAAKKLKMMAGSLSGTNIYPLSLSYYIGYAHSARFISARNAVIKTLGLNGYIYWYDDNQEYVSHSAFDTLNGEYKIFMPFGVSLFRISINNVNNGIVANGVDIECDAIGYEEQYQKLPVDSGYQNVTFVVDVDVCDQPSAIHSEVTRQYIKSTDSGVLHLPSSYRHDGKPTPLIIYIHGQADRYTVESTRFATNNRYAPEWDAAGYAQLDIDLIPDFYNYNGTDFADTGDDVACVEAAYEWCINHFNIARDGIYLMGRSRGAQAVMQVLGHYNPDKLPVLCAISNAGANTLVNYELFRQSSATEWDIFCTAFGIPSSGRPSYTSQSRNNIGALISNSDIADFLRENIDIWWDKILTGLPMLDEYPEISEDPDKTYPTDRNIFHLKLYDLIVRSYKLNTNNANYAKEYCDWLRMCALKSPVPLRFDWCNGDETQTGWSRESNSYAAVEVYAFLNDRIAGNSIYRYWPEAGVNKPQGEPTTNPHWHEYMNYYDGDYILPNGVTIHNPSMARLEWLLWCQKHDRRYNGCVQPGGVS